jgi:dynamin 1-like protein
MSFELLTKRQISRLHEPSLQCVDAVFEELQRIVSQLESKELLRYNVLREKVIEVMSELLNECRSPTRSMISNLINIELAFINTAHPDFVGANGVFTNIVEQATDEKLAQKKKEEEKAAQEKKAAQQPSVGVQYGGAQATITPKSQQQQPHRELPNPNNNNNNSNKSNQSERPTIPKTDGPQRPARGTPQQVKASNESEVFNGGRSFEQYIVPILIKPVGPLSSKENFETDLITKLLESYFAIVRKNIQDTIPKAIMHFLVTKSKLLVHNRLVQRLYIQEQFDDLLAESAEIASRRKATREMVNMLKRAQEILNEVRDYALK